MLDKEDGKRGRGILTRVNAPSRLGNDTELFIDQAIANVSVVKHVDKRRARFVMHRPSAINKFELSACYKLSDAL